jgi:nucleotide-binding universal stress UspA family protein
MNALSSVTDRPILVGVDGSDPATDAVRWAAEEASRLGSGLRIVHVWIWPLYHVQLGPAPGAPAGAGLRAQAEWVLSQAAEVAGQALPPTAIETSLITGAAALELVLLSASARMLVVGHRGLGGFTGLLLGSVGVAVSARASCPAVVVRGDETAGGAVVVGLDGSLDGRRALEAGFCEAVLRRAPLLAVHAWPLPLRTGPGELDYDSVLARGEREGRELTEKAVSEVAARFPEVSFDVSVSSRSAAAELVSRSAGAQLVVVGSRGIGAVRGPLLGSTVHALLHHSACPVLVNRSEADPGA